MILNVMKKHIYAICLFLHNTRKHHRKSMLLIQLLLKLLNWLLLLMLRFLYLPLLLISSQT